MRGGGREQVGPVMQSTRPLIHIIKVRIRYMPFCDFWTRPFTPIAIGSLLPRWVSGGALNTRIVPTLLLFQQLVSYRALRPFYPRRFSGQPQYPIPQIHIAFQKNQFSPMGHIYRKYKLGNGRGVEPLYIAAESTPEQNIVKINKTVHCVLLPRFQVNLPQK